MRKRGLLFTLLFVLILTLVGCEKTVEVPTETVEITEITEETPVASIGSRHVTWAQYRMTFETYLQYYEEMGFDVYATEQRLQGFQTRTVEALLEPYVLAYQAELAGCNVLTDAENEALQAQIDTQIAALGDAYQEQLVAEKAANPSLDEQKRLRELIAAESYYYTGISMDYDSYLAYIAEYYRDQYYVQKLREQIVCDISVTDAEVQAYYEDARNADREKFLADPAAYQYAAEQAEQIPPLFAPDGYQRLLVVSFAAQDISTDENYAQVTQQLDAVIKQYGLIALQSAMQGTEDTAALKALQETYLTLSNTKQMILDKANEAAHEEAEAVYKALEAGAEFSDLENAKTRYFAPAYQEAWSEQLYEAILLLEPGTYSPVIQDETGCHIVFYVEQVTAGDVPFEEVEDIIRSELRTQAQEAAWQEQITRYMEAPEIVRNEALIQAMGKE